jgi:SAM-dependent methyltransferase
MQAVLDGPQLAATRLALLEPGSDELIDLIFKLNLGRPTSGCSASAVDKARALGWIGSQTLELTPLGFLVADPIREYRFWLDRDRRLHSEKEYELLARDAYRGKAVLEIGSGFGCNLFSLQGVEGEFVGVEPVAVYRQFTPILAERERIAPPTVVDGRGESIPFPDARFDVVLCYSAHQYMDIRPALKEMARVVRPGGQLQIIGGTFGGYTSYAISNVIKRRRLRAAKAHLLTIINTISYCGLGKRVYIPGGEWATTAPIYPPERFMNRWLTDAGLTVAHDLFRRVLGEACFIAVKPAAN